jgi:zinc D-Ala-D-Ala dipeptidase
MRKPSDEAGTVPIRDCGELLVDVARTAPLHVSASHHGPVLRSGVVDRLVVVQSLLPRDVRLLVVAGHWPLAADPPAARPPAAHPTGAAVDLMLCGHAGAPIPMDLACDGASPTCAECDGDPAATHLHAANHGLLSQALTSMGFVNYPARWWHWSYGDRYWASATRSPHARYGPVPGD